MHSANMLVTFPNPAMPIAYRPFTNADYPQARSLWEVTPGVGLSAADEPLAIETFLARNPNLSFVALDGPLLVGTILCGHDGRRGLIHHLVAASSHRRQGIGRKLLRLGLRALHDANIDKCHLLVFSTNTDGLNFWRSVAAQERTDLSLFSLLTSQEVRRSG
jgi:ribosomal protein S18 acetylase RimI-like enzyme